MTQPAFAECQSRVRLLLSSVLIFGCSGATTKDAGFTGLAECSPSATAGQMCNPFASFPTCAATEAQMRMDMCDLRTVRGDVTGWVCDEGIQWRAFTSPQATCSFMNGELAGATIEFSDSASLSGSWQMHGCSQTELCPERDAGSCRPIVNAFQYCEEDLSRFTFCKPTETEQRVFFCSDAGWYGRFLSSCDGGTRFVSVVTGLGPTHTCFYVDGGLAGGSDISDTNRGPVGGVWQLADCQPTLLCP